MTADERPTSSSKDPYLDALASASPTPGGGSAAATVAATAAALLAMVARITAANERFANVRGEAEAIATEADGGRHALLKARSDDERAYRAVVAAQALPRASDGEREARTAALQAALGGAAAAPLYIAQLAVDVLVLAERALALENRHLASDVGCAAAFAQAAVVAAALNVRVNHTYLHDPALRTEQEHNLSAVEVDATRRSTQVRDRIANLLAR